MKIPGWVTNKLGNKDLMLLKWVGLASICRPPKIIIKNHKLIIGPKNSDPIFLVQNVEMRM